MQTLVTPRKDKINKMLIHYIIYIYLFYHGTPFSKNTAFPIIPPASWFMKTLLLLSALALASLSSAYAQSQCAPNHPLFAVNPNTRPERITVLGTAPQIDFLRGITTSEGMISALQANRHSKKYARDIQELSKVLTLIGFANGLDDAALTAASFKSENLPFGQIGNIGSDDQSYKKVILEPASMKGVPAWRITSPTGCFVYVFTKCGNFFYPDQGQTNCCREVEVSLVSQAAQSVTCEAQSIKKQVAYCIEVYYLKRVKIKGGKGSKGGSQDKYEEQGESVRIGLSDLITIDAPSNMSRTFTAALAQQEAQKLTICQDGPVTLPVSLKITQSAQSSISSTSDVAEATPLRVQIKDRRSFKRLKRRLKNITCAKSIG